MRSERRDGYSLSDAALGAWAPDAGTDAPALIAGKRRWSWSDLASAVRAERERLSASGAADTDAIAFDARPTAGVVIRLLALIDAGVCAVPLHPKLSPAERAAWLAHVAESRSVYDLDTGERVPGDVRSAAVDGGPTEESSLAVLFTSGSGGAPRAVDLSRRAFRASARASAKHLGWRDDDRWICCLPLAHVGGLSILTRCLLARRTIVLAEGGFEPQTVLRLIESEAVTLASFVPTMLHRLFEADRHLRLPARLRAVLLGGAPASPDLWGEIERRAFPALATYGMTETCSQVATARAEEPRRLLPLAGVRLRVTDGRIEVAGPMLGVPVGGPGEEPAWTADGFFRTGDLGRLADGALEVLGRADDTIVTGGENVVPAGVESTLAEHPAVRRAVVFGLPDPTWGELVGAVLESEPGVARPSDEELRAWLETRLARFRRPRRIAWTADLPETPIGKPDRRAAVELGRDRMRPL